MKQEIKSIDLTEDEENVELYLGLFVKEMNRVARKIGMYDTKFTNAHGLDYRNNYSTCEDMLKLSLCCYNN
jgi:D-alanyl-D-alanine carboxypeptidase